MSEKQKPKKITKKGKTNSNNNKTTEKIEKNKPKIILLYSIEGWRF